METDKLTQSSILSAMLIILSVILIGTGIGGTLYIDFVVPIVITIIYIRCGMKWTILASINTLCVVALGLGRPTTALWMFQSVLLGILAGYLLKRSSQIMDDLLTASLCGCFIMLVMDYLLNLLTGISILDDSLNLFEMRSLPEIAEVMYYLSIAALPIGTMVIVYTCSLFALKRLNLLSAVTKDKYKVIRNFFKYRPYMYCTRKMLIIAIGYIILSLFLPVSEIAYIKALMVTTKYIAFYFVVSDCWAIVNHWFYIKTKSVIVTTGLLYLLIVGMMHSFKLCLYALVGIGLILDLSSQIRQQQGVKLYYLLKH